MTNTVIQLKKSATPSQVPSDLANGELAINYADGKLFYKDASGNIQQISSGGNTFSTINAAGTFVVADLQGDILTLDQGANIIITGDAINDKITIAANLVPAFDYANTVGGGDISPAFDKANAANVLACTAFDQANSKTYTFYQNTAPTTSNAHDLWANSDTGVVYQNFGTTSTPIWAEFGPTTYTSNGQPGVGSFTNLTVSGNATIQKQVFVTYTPSSTVNAAVEISAANTKGGTGYADVLKLTNIGGGVTNPAKWIRVTSAGALEVINSSYQMASATLSDAGNFTAAGTITPGAWSAGQVIKDTMLSNSEVTVVSTTIAASGSTTNFVTYNYTPVSASSYLLIHYHLSKYAPAGTTDDSWFSQLLVDGNEIAYGWQMVNDNGTGTSGRSGVLFPLTGRYTNSSTSAKQIQVAARRDSADDSITIDNTATSMWLRITEIAR